MSKLRCLIIAGTIIKSLDEKIGNLTELETLIIEDSMLDKLPETVFNLPRLTELGIARNNFKEEAITAIKEKLETLQSKAQTNAPSKVELQAQAQGYGQNYKKLITANRATCPEDEYYELCLAALDDNPGNIAIANPENLKTQYAKICFLAVEKGWYAIEKINPEKLDKPDYVNICLEAANGRTPRSGNRGDITKYFYKYLRTDLLTSGQYMQICEKAIPNSFGWDKLSGIDSSLLKREDYEKLCKQAITISSSCIRVMKDPTPEHCLLAAQKGANLDDIPEQFRTYKICLAAMKQQKSHHESLQFVPEQHKTPELCLAAVTTNEKSIEHVPEPLKTEEHCLAAVSQINVRKNYDDVLCFIPAAFRDKIKQSLDDKKAKKKEHVPVKWDDEFPDDIPF
jgi:hypothetical protein